MRSVVVVQLAFVLSALLLSPADCRAQRGRGWRWDGTYGRQYDVTTVRAISGQITGVQRFVRGMGYCSGTHIIVQTESEKISVHLGPTWFVDSRGLSLEEGDRIEVAGSMIIYSGLPAMIAARVKKGEDTLLLRDDQGYPAWGGWRRGRWYSRPW
jgi:hypothetical protein